MTKNPILDELHAIREQLLADSGGTLDALVDRLQTEEQGSDRPQFEARRTRQCPGAATPDEIAADNQSSRPSGR
jgi:hypothetical protein